MLVAIGVAQDLESACEVINYEAPFGVGYLVAQLLNAKSEPLAVAGGPVQIDSSSAALPALARAVVETFITTGDVIKAPQDLSDLLSQRAGCFVSLKTRAGELRGCIGTSEPVKGTLVEEIIANAISAATSDPRFPPVREDELAELKYSVDVLSQPERARLGDLDPTIYGVIVEDKTGVRRGLLLPNLKGIETPDQQVEIASRKAGIPAGDEKRLWRFRAERYREA
jgi:MEMO1 family protein